MQTKQKTSKTMVKFLLGGLWSIGFFLGMTLASSGNISLSTQLVNDKDTLLTQIQTSQETLSSEYTRVLGPEIQTANYQSLICLGVIKDESLLQDMEGELWLLKTNLLQDYVNINADIFNLLNQYSVGLIDDNTYLTQYHKLTLDVQSFYDNNKVMIDQTYNKYLQKIFNTVEENKAYTQNNSELLSSINSKITKIQSTVNQFKLLEEGVFEINNALNLHQWSFFDTIQNTKIATVHMLQDEINQQIKKYDRKYTNNPELKKSYEQQRDSIVQNFSDKLDSIIHDSIGSWYDADQYEYLKTQIDLIKNRFYEENSSGEKLNCTKVIATDLDLDGYINDIELETKALKKDVSRGVWALIAVDSGVDIRQELLKSLKDAYISQYNKSIISFKNFVKTHNTISSSVIPQDTVKTQNIDVLALKKFIFNSPFKKGEISEGVKQLQLLLNKLWYYHGQIFGKYDTPTIEAVYQFQLAKWILKGVPWETAQGYMWPSTRNALNQEMSLLFKPTSLPSISKNPKDISWTIQKETNPFVPLLQKLSRRYNNQDIFKETMQKALANLSKQLEEWLSPSKTIVFENIIEAIQQYLAIAS